MTDKKLLSKKIIVAFLKAILVVIDMLPAIVDSILLLSVGIIVLQMTGEATVLVLFSILAIALLITHD